MALISSTKLYRKTGIILVFNQRDLSTPAVMMQWAHLCQFFEVQAINSRLSKILTMFCLLPRHLASSCYISWLLICSHLPNKWINYAWLNERMSQQSPQFYMHCIRQCLQFQGNVPKTKIWTVVGNVLVIEILGHDLTVQPSVSESNSWWNSLWDTRKFEETALGISS